MAQKKIIVISSLSSSLLNFRLDLLRSFVINGYEVVALGPNNDEEVRRTLEIYGIKFLTYYLERNGFNPLKDISTMQSFRKIYKDEKPSFILPYTVKPVIYSNLAKVGLEIKSLNWITGLGFYGLDSRGLKDNISKFIMTILYRKAFQKNDIIAFQNLDDLDFFKQKGILRNNRFVITPGSGINLEKYNYSNPRTDSFKFVFVGRLLEAKGINVFVEAAKIIKDKNSNVEFIAVGGIDEGNPNALTIEDVNDLKERGIVNFVGHVSNAIDYVKDSSVFVLPSMYREGVPRSILEALSLGRPIITTDNVGCRETVIRDYNGILIEKNNVNQLVEAMMFFINNVDKIIEYGINSRQLAEDRFDVSIVNKIMLNSLKEL